jgi:trk system potassium uptake protein TrkH
MARLIADLPMIVILMGLTALAMLVPAAHGFVVDREATGRVFLQTGLILLVLTGMIGLAAARRGRPAPQSLLGTLGLSYAVLPLMMALPFWQAVGNTTLANAWFEFVSCFTTTGATVYGGPGRLDGTLHLWRALAGWLGGFYFLVMAGAVLGPMNLAGAEVIAGRMPGRAVAGAAQVDRAAGPDRRVAAAARQLLPVWLGLTVALWVGLVLAGDAGLVGLIHAMSTLSASGITTGAPFSGAAAGLPGEVLVFAMMGLALTRRALPGRSIVDRSGPLWRDPELRIAAILLGCVTLILFLRHWSAAISFDQGEDVPSALRAAWGGLFTAMSFLTTTGFESAQWEVARSWSGLGSPGLVLAGLAIMGGGVATTAGGVKLLRVYALFRHGERELERIIHPSSVGGQGSAARRLRREGAVVAWVFFMLFATSIAAVTAALTLAGIEFAQALVLGLSALTLTGPLIDLAGSAPIDLAALGGGAKTILGVTMVVGRLEILAVLALFAPDSWRR